MSLRYGRITTLPDGFFENLIALERVDLRNGILTGNVRRPGFRTRADAGPDLERSAARRDGDPRRHGVHDRALGLERALDLDP